MSGAKRVRDDLAFRPDVAGLRAIAVVAVVAYHADRQFVPGGFVGVDIFFVISGYLISRIILDESRDGRFSLAGFYAKRVRRIFPALILVLATAWCIAFIRLDPVQFFYFAREMRDGAFFILNFLLAREGGYFDVTASLKPLLHLWSLSIEEQFYIVWPALMMALGTRRSLVLPAMMTLLVLSLGYCLVETVHLPRSAFFLPWGRVWELALGGTLAYRELAHPEGASSTSTLRADAGVVAGLVLMLASIAGLQEGDPFPGWRALLPTLGCGLVIAHPGSPLAARLLGNAAARAIGAISYALYLWHWPLLSFAHVAYGETIPPLPLTGLVALAVILATLTYVFIEQPSARIFRERPWALTIALVAGIVACGLVAHWTVARKGFESRFSPQLLSIFHFPPKTYFTSAAACFFDDFKQRGDDAQIVAAYFDTARCATRAAPEKPLLLVIGDSHAAALVDGLGAVLGNRYEVMRLTARYCPPGVADVRATWTTSGSARCRAVNDYVSDAVRRLKPAVVVVGGYFDELLNNGGRLYPDYVADLKAGTRTLHAAGAGAVIVAGEIPTWDPSVPALVGHELMDGEPAAEFSRRGLRTETLDLDARLRRQDWGPGTTYVSLAATLCTPQGCRRRVGPNLPDDMIAIDYGHLSARGSIFVARTILAPAIVAARPTP